LFKRILFDELFSTINEDDLLVWEHIPEDLNWLILSNQNSLDETSRWYNLQNNCVRRLGVETLGHHEKMMMQWFDLSDVTSNHNGNNEFVMKTKTMFEGKCDDKYWFISSTEYMDLITRNLQFILQEYSWWLPSSIQGTEFNARPKTNMEWKRWK
jgi:hypothetical protein